MAQKTIQGNETLAKQIKARRNELGITIEEAASRAGVGTKTWCRYEAGGSIRRDKSKGICKALNWRSLPDQDEEESEQLSIEAYQNHEAWSPFLCDHFGAQAAMSFAAGSDIFLDQIKEDMRALASMPGGTHIGQLDVSWLEGGLPEQFLMQYTYEFLYQMKCTLLGMRMRAQNGMSMTAHSVLEELILYCCCEEASVLIELSGGPGQSESFDKGEVEDWVFDLFDDEDIITFLYSNVYLEEGHPYHFSNWTRQQFYVH